MKDYNITKNIITKNIVSGFRGAGIVPLDRNQVLKRLAQKEGDYTSASDKSDSGSQWVATFETYL